MNSSISRTLYNIPNSSKHPRPLSSILYPLSYRPGSPLSLLSLTFQPMMTPFLQTRLEGEDLADERKKNRRKAEVQSRPPSGNPPGEMSNARRNIWTERRMDARMYGCVRTCGCWGCADECTDVFLRMFEGFFFSFSLVLLFFFFSSGRACRGVPFSGVPFS